MSKRFTKIICLVCAVVVAVASALIAGCSGVYKASPLSKAKGEIFTSDEAVSNGGFAVEKENYVYFINGKQNNSADNTFGTPVKGAIYRIAKTDLAARNYSAVDCVVPLVTYSGNQDAGIFIYGDYIYYSTPSTGKTANGVVENTKLDLKRTKLDGTDTMMGAFVQFDDNSTEFRFVEVENVVYILYVVKDGEDDNEITNLHSFNTKTGVDTLLAYNVGAVQFDTEDKTNPRVYYTMGVYDYAADADFNYNQIYTVTADETTPNEYDFSSIVGWNDDEKKGEVDKYVNCGSLVFDGIGRAEGLNKYGATPFNFDPTGETRNELSYTYTLRAYVNGNVFYTRNTNEGNEHLFSVKESNVLATGWNPVTNNAIFNKDTRENILNDGSAASDYKYIFDDSQELTAVLVADDDGIAVNKVVDGKLQTGKVGSDNYFRIAEGSSAKVLFTDDSDGAHKYLYYSVSADGSNGYTVYRVDYSGSKSNYDTMQLEETEFTPVRVLDLDACSDWYLPELIQGQILFASETDKMTNYNYVMACDIRKDATTVMTNKEIRDLNEKYKGINDIFDDLSDTETYPTTTYANMVKALKYAHYTGEDWNVYLKDLAEVCNAELEEDADRVYSEETRDMYNEFIAPQEGGIWTDYQDKKEVNGKEVYANRRDYYYSLIGKMSGEDAKNYAESLKTEYLVSYPEHDSTWWENINTAAKVCFIIGMCAIGILVIGGGVVLVLVLIKRKNNKMPEYKKKKIKVDTTDDKNIDVYSDNGNTDGNAEESGNNE